jgi:mono/diheme cytochrome c family protein
MNEETMKRAALSVGILASCGFVILAATHASVPTLAAESGASAQAVYLDNCSGCHGAAGEGEALIAPPLRKNPYVTGNAKTLIRAMLAGMVGPIKERGATWNGSMPPWQDMLSNAQLADVITYIRSSWGNHATPVTQAQVAAEAGHVPAPSAAVPLGNAAPGSMQAQELYVVNCSGCHGVTGQGSVGPPLAHNTYVTGNSSKVVAIVLDGAAGPVKERGVTWNGAMPPWRGMLTNTDLAAVITYIRHSWGNHASAVDESQIAGK